MFLKRFYEYGLKHPRYYVPVESDAHILHIGSKPMLDPRIEFKGLRPWPVDRGSNCHPNVGCDRVPYLFPGEKGFLMFWDTHIERARTFDQGLCRRLRQTKEALLEGAVKKPPQKKNESLLILLADKGQLLNDLLQDWHREHFQETFVQDREVVRGDCFLSGRRNVPIQRIHLKVQIGGGKAPLVSFKEDAWKQKGLEGCFNFPCSFEAVHAYVSGVQDSLDKYSVSVSESKLSTSYITLLPDLDVYEIPVLKPMLQLLGRPKMEEVEGFWEEISSYKPVGTPVQATMMRASQGRVAVLQCGEVTDTLLQQSLLRMRERTGGIPLGYLVKPWSADTKRSWFDSTQSRDIAWSVLMGQRLPKSVEAAVLEMTVHPKRPDPQTLLSWESLTR